MDIAERKVQLRKLAALDSDKAEQYLASSANELAEEVKRSVDNDYVADRLNLLTEFAYRVPTQALEVIRFVLGSKPVEPQLIKSRFGEHLGNTHTNLILKAIELLDHLRYIVTDDVLSLAAELSIHEQKEVREQALRIADGYASYDFRVMRQIGYSAQRKMVDFMVRWSMEQRILHFDFLEAAVRSLLSSSVMSSEMTDVNKFTMTYGQVTPTESLKEIHRQVMDMVSEMFRAIPEAKSKLRLVRLLDNVTQPPHNVQMTAELSEMLIQDSTYLVGIYRQMVSAGVLAVTSHIENRLYWMNKTKTYKTQESVQLRDEIMADDLYQLFDLLAGDRAGHYRNDGGWEMSERKRAQRVRSLIESVDEQGLPGLSDQLNRIAGQQSLVESWRYSSFEDFLIQLSETKPREADLLFEDAFARQLPLRSFVIGFLIGLRVKNEFELWDKYAEKIIELRQVEYVVPLIRSLCLPKGIDLQEAIRQSDLDIVDAAVNRSGPLSFAKGSDDPLIHFATLETILRCLSRAPTRMQSLLVSQIEDNPLNLHGSLSQLYIAIARDWIHMTELLGETVNFIASKLIEVPDLDWEMQDLLLEIGHREGCRFVLNLVMKRIRFYESLKKAHAGEYYESIPFHIDPRLQQFIGENAEYKETMAEWLGSMTAEWSIYNWEVSRFLQTIERNFDEILLALIEKGDDNSLDRAATAIHSMERSSTRLSIEIARRTENEDILHKISANLLSTGVVSGEYGIAIAFENKAKELEQYQGDSSERVRTFVGLAVQNLKEAAKRERQRAEESMQLRRIEFEG